MTTPNQQGSNDAEYDDLTPYLLDLARQIDQERARTAASVLVSGEPEARLPEVSTQAARRLAHTPVEASPNTGDGRVRFTLTVSGSADPVAIGVLVSLVAILIAMIAG